MNSLKKEEKDQIIAVTIAVIIKVKVRVISEIGIKSKDPMR